MAANHATPFPIRAQAYRVLLSFRDTSGVLITTWNTPVAIISEDGAATASTTNNPTEIGTSGMGYLDLTAAEMDNSHSQIKASVSNANATATVIEIVPLLAEPTGHACDDEVIRFDKVLWNIFQYWMNKNQIVRATGAFTAYKSDDETEAFAGTYSNTGIVAEKTKIA